MYINLTTGTWPSPFWLLLADSIWRSEGDHGFSGPGTPRQQWITYRDHATYDKVVKTGPLYPLNSLMVHGIIKADFAPEGLRAGTPGDFRDEVRSFFASGTQLQELYLSHRLLTEENWDDLAAAAKWARARANILVDTHWIGGAPRQGQVYGWAAWTPAGAVVSVRNPSESLQRSRSTRRGYSSCPPARPRPIDSSVPTKTSAWRPRI
jgi:hypothetical protein